MAYCAITDVEALNPQRGAYGASTKPTSTQVTGFMTYVSDEMDSILGARGVTVPVTAPAEFLSHLKQVNAYGAAALAEQAMFPEAVGTPGGSPHGQWLWTVYKRMTDRLEKGALPVDTAATDGPRSFFERETGDEPTEDREWRRPRLPRDKEF